MSTRKSQPRAGGAVLGSPSSTPPLAQQTSHPSTPSPRPQILAGSPSSSPPSRSTQAVFATTTTTEEDHHDSLSTPPPISEDILTTTTSTPQPPDLPMSMTASILLTTLPQDTTQALQTANASLDSLDDFKVPVRFSSLPGAPALGKQKVFKISASRRFEAVVNFLRTRLGLNQGQPGQQGQSLYCYVNAIFAPGLDEGVGNLYRCFKTDDQLNVSYSITPAFG